MGTLKIPKKEFFKVLFTRESGPAGPCLRQLILIACFRMLRFTRGFLYGGPRRSPRNTKP